MSALALLAWISRTGQVHRGSNSEKIMLAQWFVSGCGGVPMPTECSAVLFEFARVEGRSVVAGFDGGKITSDAGALLLGASDQAIGLIDRFARCFADRRSPELVEHKVATLVGQRVFGLALGYEAVLDHDELRHDPMMAVLAGKLAARRKGCAPGGWQIDAQSARIGQAGADGLSQDRAQSASDRSSAGRSIYRGPCPCAAANHSRSGCH